jgi:hypothetical protein
MAKGSFQENLRVSLHTLARFLQLMPVYTAPRAPLRPPYWGISDDHPSEATRKVRIFYKLPMEMTVQTPYFNSIPDSYKPMIH